jgi:hypothetical protein
LRVAAGRETLGQAVVLVVIAHLLALLAVVHLRNPH